MWGAAGEVMTVKACAREEPVQVEEGDTWVMTDMRMALKLVAHTLGLIYIIHNLSL